MSEEKSLANIAQTAYWAMSENQDTFDRVAKAVEKEVLARLNKSVIEPVAGQELSFVQVARWVDRHGSTKGLQRRDNSGNWRDDVIYSFLDYRVAPEKVNDPDDPTTWVTGAKILVRNHEETTWVLRELIHYYPKQKYGYFTHGGESWPLAKLATPEQIEAWNKLQEE